MMITKEQVLMLLRRYNVSVSGVLHIGAHECEETDVYRYLGIPDNNVIWIEALDDKVAMAKKNGIATIYKAIISDKDNESVVFYRTVNARDKGNAQSSSILPLGTHAKHYPWITVEQKFTGTTITIDTFFKENNLDVRRCDFWNLDIQGAELKALKGGESSLKYAKVVYLEVNTEEVYQGCAKLAEIDAYLGQHGFQRIASAIVKEGWGDAMYIRTG